VVEIQEQIEKAVEEAEEAHEAKGARFRNRVAIYVGLVGLALAIVHMAGAAASKHAMLSGLETSDTYAYYQAKVIRTSILESTTATLNQIGATTQDNAVKAKIADQTKSWAADIQKMTDDPKGGHGEKQLLATAGKSHQRQLRSMARDENYDLAETLLQVAIVFASISIVATSPALVGASVVMAILGALAGLNGWLLLVELV
jgi:hypothetical protein